MLYNVFLFAHILGLIGLFGGLIIFHRAGARLRAATTLGQARTWIGLLQLTPPMYAGGLGILLASGLVMSAIRWRESVPWILVAFAGLVVIGILTGAIGSRRLKAIDAALRAAGAADGPIPGSLLQQILDPLPWVAVSAANGLALAAVWLMTTKPGWVVSLAVVAGAGLAGAVVGTLVLRHRPAGRPQHSGGD